MSIKKQWVIILFFTFLIMENSHSQIIKYGSSVTDLYYGYRDRAPLLLELESVATSKTYYSDKADENVSLKATNFFGFHYQKIFTDTKDRLEMGVGCDIAYSSGALSFDRTYENEVTNHYYNFYRVAVNVTYNMFMNTINEKLYFFGTVGIGFKVKNYSEGYPEVINDVDYTYADWIESLPVSILVRGGVRYFVTNNLGLHLSASLGNGFINGGITYAWNKYKN